MANVSFKQNMNKKQCYGQLFQEFRY